MDLKISITIPTYNRTAELIEVFKSILNQTKKPREIIIVDDSDTDIIEELITNWQTVFIKRNIQTKYIRNTRGKSLTKARNIGIENVSGDILLFLDDDVILEKDYLDRLTDIYSQIPSAIGVQGLITNYEKTPRKRLLFNKIFLIGYFSKNDCKVLPSTNVTYPCEPDKIISCQWISGANQSYRCAIFDEFQYDENLVRYSYKEDVDFSYRIFKKYPNSLYITPYARLEHKESDIARLPNQKRITMEYVYSFYFFYKNFSPSLTNKILFFWSWIGYLIIAMPVAVIKKILGSDDMFLRISYSLKALILCFRNLNNIKRENLDFFNNVLLK